jgi:SpoVK/Ycf46/Vps4 family AAA+-type ATPase
MNLLFWGWPGTGKTEFGKYIADQLGKELLVKRMSDLQSMWVGETEKQIAAAFREAEENDAILFIDEADSVFINRQTANKSWETSQTNEILTQMENFSGILICCTNLLENLDEAAMRRFAFKIKFLPLTNEGKVRLYQKYFSSLTAPLSKEQQSRLVAIRNLCPGDIKAVWQRTQMLGNSPSDEIISELEKEVSYKKGGNKSTIGFAAG